MANFSRKIKRKQLIAARKQFMKHFKKTMKNFKKQVKCTACGREPYPGENIDNWHIDQKSETIDLICTECANEEQAMEGEQADV